MVCVPQNWIKHNVATNIALKDFCTISFGDPSVENHWSQVTSYQQNVVAFWSLAVASLLVCDKWCKNVFLCFSTNLSVRVYASMTLVRNSRLRNKNASTFDFLWERYGSKLFWKHFHRIKIIRYFESTLSNPFVTCGQWLFSCGKWVYFQILQKMIVWNKNRTRNVKLKCTTVLN